MPFGYNIFVAFWAGHYTAEKIGCEVIPGGVLDIEKNWIAESEARYEAYKRGELEAYDKVFLMDYCVFDALEKNFKHKDSLLISKIRYSSRFYHFC
jgi:hypothetical protein